MRKSIVWILSTVQLLVAAANGAELNKPVGAPSSPGPAKVVAPASPSLGSTNVANPGTLPAVAMNSIQLDVPEAVAAVGGKATLRATAKSLSPAINADYGYFDFSVDGKTVNSGGYFPTNGAAQMDYTLSNDLKPGPHALKVTYTYTGTPAGGYGNGTSFKVSRSANLAVVKSAVVMAFTAKEENPYWVGNKAYDNVEGEPMDISGNIKRITDQKGLAGRAVAIKVNGALFKTLATDDNGYFTTKYTLPNNAGGKSFNFEAQFDGDDMYLASGGSAKINAIDKPAALKAGYIWVTDHLTLTLGQPYNIGVIVGATNSGANLPPMGGLANKQVRLVLQFKGPQGQLNAQSLELGSATTNAQGIAVISGKSKLFWGTGANTLVAFVDSLADYGTNVNNASLTLLPTSVKVNVTGPSSAVVGSTIKLTSTSTADSNGETFANSGYVLVNGQTISADNNGAFDFKIPSNFTIGTNVITVGVQSDAGAGYKAATGKHTIVIKPNEN